MFGEFWVSVPVRDVLKTSEFYKSLGFEPDFEHGGAEMGVKFAAGSNQTILWFYADKVFENFSQASAVNAKKEAEVLFSIYVENKERVDEIARQVFEAGGRIFAEPSSKFEGFYGCGIADLDGHRWALLTVDKKDEK